jgi:hypothetical protein
MGGVEEMVVKKAPREILGMGFTVAGGVLIVVAIFILGLWVATMAAAEEIPEVAWLSLPVSVAMIAVGIVFSGVGFYIQSTPARQGKR